MEFHGIQKIGTLTKLVSGSKQWKSKELVSIRIKYIFNYIGLVQVCKAISHAAKYLTTKVKVI